MARWDRLLRRPRSGLVLPLEPVAAVPRVGVEHEHRLWRSERQVDFRGLLPEVAGDLRALDPGDPRARRLPSGVALTADGLEAELATPPVPVGAGAPQRLDGLLRAERTTLAREAAPYGVDAITGFSTHVNVSVPDERVVEVGQRFARHCGLATALVAEPASSLGLLVRPRRGRLEVGCEYAEGPDLLALVTFVAAAVAALRGPAPPPPTPAPVLTASREKYGWFLAPEGAWAEVVSRGAAARLGLVSAADHLARTWDWARPACLAAGLDPAPVDHVASVGPLRVERTTSPERCTFDPPGSPAPSAGCGPDTSPRERPGGIRGHTRWLTWNHVTWELQRDDRSLFAVVPAEQEGAFLCGLDAGEHDDVLATELARRRDRRHLVVHAQLSEAAWWHTVRPGALVPAERAPDGSVPRVSSRRARQSLRA